MSAATGRFVVTGRVQGVGFRAATREQARALGLRGIARNCADGSVEVLAAGDPQAVESLALWLQHGPPPARVERLERFPLDPSSMGSVGSGFATG